MAKKSRRARRQTREERQETTTPSAESSPSATATEASIPEPVSEERSSPRTRQDSNFRQEYFYVYTDLRNILIVAILMVGVLIGLSFVI